MELERVKGAGKFPPLIMNHETQQVSVMQLGKLLDFFSQAGYAHQIARQALDRSFDLDQSQQSAAIWLTMMCIDRNSHDQNSIADLVDLDSDESPSIRPILVSDVYATTLPWLLESDRGHGWRSTALAIEATVMQANLLKTSYRPELLDTLYPILALLGSSNSQLRSHAVAGLNLLTSACAYPSTSDLLISNVDYLINAVGMKLNSFEISPQAPQVLLMMLRLCGARIVPYLDDLMGSIFSALDNFHGYPELVGLLFQVLKVVVEESRKQPQLALTNGTESLNHRKTAGKRSELVDIVEDLDRRRARKRKTQYLESAAGTTPRQPWKSFESEMADIRERDKESTGEPQDEESANSVDKTEDAKLNKPHQLLLNIAKSTTAHLSSPSPQVRKLLLQLLDEITPILATDENSFLPLINSVWPSLMPRLLNYNDDALDFETSYNICAAADTAAAFCRAAGDFMASRVDQIFPRLAKVFQKLSDANNGPGKQSTPRATSIEMAVQSLAPSSMGISKQTLRTSNGMVLISFVKLLTIILSHVRVSTDVGNDIVSMLAPFSQQNSEVEDALEAYNSDALWLRRRQHLVKA
jgi:hypothetical protein